MICKKGEEMPTDYLSRHVVASPAWSELEIQTDQEADEVLLHFLASQELPEDQDLQNVSRCHAKGCFLEDDFIWKKINQWPYFQAPIIIKDACSHHLSRHNGIYQTKVRILQNYYWSGMDTDIQDLI